MSINEKVDIVAAPMSFAGSLGRTLNAFWNGKPLAYKVSVGWLIVGFVTIYWWTFVFVWYLFWGILLVPYRIVRRSAREQKIERRKFNEIQNIEERRHAELLEALKNKD